METRVCKLCGIEKELTTQNFERATPYKDHAYFRHTCIPCARPATNQRKRERRKKYRALNPLPGPPPDVYRVTDGNTYRTCTRCNEEKELEQNFREQLAESGNITRRHICRKCEYRDRVHYARQPKNLPIIMLQSARHRAKRDGVPCTITAKDIVIPEKCPLLGVKLEQGTRRNHVNAPTLDKIIPELGYVPGNIRVISHRANLAKNDLSVEELKRLLDNLSRAI